MKTDTLLILSNSFDGSSDILCELATRRGIDIFRFNTDLFDSYEVSLGNSGFRLRDPAGRSVTEQSVSSCYWRKPFISGDPPEDRFPVHERRWVRAHQHAVVRELAAWCRDLGKLRLVDPLAENRLGKVRQMRLARNLLSIPPWEVSSGVRLPRERRVVKTLSPEMIESERLGFVFTTAVNADELDPRYTWFTQEEVGGREEVNEYRDVTTVFVAGKIFSFRLTTDRSLSGIDWRERIGDDTLVWERFTLPEHLATAITQYMHKTNLKFGRLDFIDDGHDLHFLEVNPNGQYGWLDDDSLWLHGTVLDAILNSETSIDPV